VTYISIRAYIVLAAEYATSDASHVARSIMIPTTRCCPAGFRCPAYSWSWKTFVHSFIRSLHANEWRRALQSRHTPPLTLIDMVKYGQLVVRVWQGLRRRADAHRHMHTGWATRIRENNILVRCPKAGGGLGKVRHVEHSF